jgi:hypothetical protein
VPAEVAPSNALAFNELHDLIGDFVGDSYFHLHPKFCSEFKTIGVLIA